VVADAARPVVVELHHGDAAALVGAARVHDLAGAHRREAGEVAVLAGAEALVGLEAHLHRAAGLEALAPPDEHVTRLELAHEGVGRQQAELAARVHEHEGPLARLHDHVEGRDLRGIAVLRGQVVLPRPLGVLPASLHDQTDLSHLEVLRLRFCMCAFPLGRRKLGTFYTRRTPMSSKPVIFPAYKESTKHEEWLYKHIFLPPDIHAFHHQTHA